ncbi:MAG: tetratricopeptide repeat protein [Candidatus Coatesbacteria bacterium]|nr:MAG: tetratricopeptide repeat protein [Candidatus Coatesbacteria bacterium]
MFKKMMCLLFATASLAAADYPKPELERADIDEADLAKFKEAYAFYLEAVEYEKAGSWVSASQAYREAVKIYPAYPDALYGLGRMGLRLGRLDEAEDSLREALTLNPELYEAHNELGNVHYRREEYNKAAYEYKETLKQDPEDVIARYNLAKALRNLGNPKEAVSQFEKVLAKDPRYVDCHYEMALAYEDLGKIDEAVAAYDKFIEVVGSDPDQAEWVNRAKEYKQKLLDEKKGK